MRSTPPLPLPVKRALAKLGEDIRSARLRRRITTTTMAERAFITRPTLRKVEHGDPGVALGIWLNRRLSPVGFYRLVTLLMFISGAKLLHDGIGGLLHG